MLQEAISTFEELKKYVFVIDRGTKGRIVLRFSDKNFYHLVGLHKTNINMFIPEYIKSQSKKYKYLKKNVKKYDNILKNQIKDKTILELRIKTFNRILNLLTSNDNATLYNLKVKVPGSLYDGDYGILKIYDDNIYCLLGLKEESENSDIVNCVPQSWMASKRPNKIVQFKAPIYMRMIIAVPLEVCNAIDEIEKV